MGCTSFLVGDMSAIALRFLSKPRIGDMQSRVHLTCQRRSPVHVIASFGACLSSCPSVSFAAPQ
ncbi:hypothetical protein BDI4_120216 [Burkholderia diffusa]|nr:hypothetical protein BDI4_120216 [Burkholderia diffusa]